MKSELVPGYEFNHTFDGVIFNEYDEFLHKKYKVNRAYIHNHIEELIQLPDVYIAIPPTSVFHKEFIHKRFMDDLDVGDGKLGLYQWCNLFFKIHACPWEYTKEHYCRMLLDLVKKYPEHSEIIQLIEK